MGGVQDWEEGRKVWEVFEMGGGGCWEVIVVEKEVLEVRVWDLGLWKILGEMEGWRRNFFRGGDVGWFRWRSLRNRYN